jgi:P-type Ca2+ transporter type 2C
MPDEKNDNKQWIDKSVDDVLQGFDVDAQQGLSDQEVQQRLDKHGRNRLRESETRSAWEILIEQFKSIVVLLLLIASVTSFAFGDLIEGVAILLAIAVNAVIGFTTEMRAVRSMQALREMSKVNAQVRRDGSVQEIEAEEIVPGDVLLVDEGAVISADVRLIKASKLQVDESPLTGESVPVTKQTEAIDADTELAEQDNMLFKGTTVTRGAGEGVVVATGMGTELGHISELVEEADAGETPLKERLDALGKRLGGFTIVVAILVAVAGLLSGKEVSLMIETAIALAVAAIPEGLPIVATVALANGMRRMADRNALVEKLETVETLGATNVLFTDKTGTLTENEMSVARYAFAGGAEVEVKDDDAQAFQWREQEQAADPDESPVLKEALRIGMLCSQVNVNGSKGDEEQKEDDDGGDTVGGDPLEVALINAGRKHGFSRPQLLEAMPEEREVPFDRETKMMATYHKQDGDYYVAVKGAPEAVFDACTQIKTTEGDETQSFNDDDCDHWRERNKELAADGLRMLALAYKTVSSTDAEPYEDLTLVGLVGLVDPPREAVPDAIAEFQSAGIKVIMLTGDQAETARNIGVQVGLADEDADVVPGHKLDVSDGLQEDELKAMRNSTIFARITPEEKLSLIELYQEDGKRVAMTGDGVNDAPALQKADIGIAMGKRGTQAAKEAADMVLQDDALGSIALAVEQGRIIFGNIRKFIIFLLSGNLSEILIVGVASLFAVPLPLLPLQILYLNAIIDVFPALALGVGPGSGDVMKNAPRDPNEPVLTRDRWMGIFGYSVVIAAAALAVFAYAQTALDVSETQVITSAYLTLALGRLWHVFNMRDNDASPFNNDITRNRWVWGAIVLSGVLIFASVLVPGFNNLLGTAVPTAQLWPFIIAGSIIPTIIIQIAKSIIGQRESD